jgi:general secretion pathway protein J
VRRAGFTLIEVLVALAVLALFGVLALRGLDALVGTERALAATAERWRTLDRFFARLEADVRLALPQPADAREEPALWSRGGQAGELRLTRAGTPRADTLTQRVGYRLRGATVEVLYLPGPVSRPEAAPGVHALLEGVREMAFEFPDARGQWAGGWPRPGAEALPTAMRVRLVLDSGERLERLYALR